MKFTILFTMTPAFDPHAGGVQQTTFKLGRFFSEKGHHVHYFSMSDKGHKKCSYGNLHIAANEGGQNSTQNNEQLKAVLKETKPDVVINQMPYEEKMRETLASIRDEMDFLLLGCLRNALFSVKNNLDEYARSQLPGFLKSFAKNMFVKRILLQIHKKRHAKDLRSIIDAHDYFILLTPSNKMELEWFIGKYKQRKIKVIPNSIPSVVESKDTYPHKIVHVGRLNTKQKRSDLLIPLWEKLVHRLPDWEFVIVGDGPYRKSMEKEISKKSLDRIKLVGYADPEPYYNDASLFVMTSSFEGFPNVLLEAQSYGLVSYAFNSYPALSDIVQDKVNGFVIEPFNVKIMANRIIEIANSKERLSEISSSSLKNARKYTTEKVGEQWLHFFEKELST